MKGLMKEFLIILVTSLVVGIGSSYVVNTINLARIETRLEERSMYVDKQIELLQDVVETLQTMQVEMSRSGERMNWVMSRVDNLDKLPEINTRIALLDKRVEILEGKD